MNIQEAIDRFIEHITNNKDIPDTDNQVWAMEMFQDYISHFSGLNKIDSGFAQGDNEIIAKVEEISPGIIDEFLNAFTVKRVASSKNDMVTYLNVLKLFIKWLENKKAITQDKSETLLEQIKKNKKLPLIPEITDLMFELAQKNANILTAKQIASVFEVIKKQKRMIIIKDILKNNQKYTLALNDKINALLLPGMILNIEIAESNKNWILTHIENAFLKDVSKYENI